MSSPRMKEYVCFWLLLYRFEARISQILLSGLNHGQMCYVELRVAHLVADSIIKLVDILNESTRERKGI